MVSEEAGYGFVCFHSNVKNKISTEIYKRLMRADCLDLLDVPFLVIFVPVVSFLYL